MAKKLVCDRCGAKLKDKDDIELALEGKWVWQAAVRARNAEPRGVFPCQHIVRCGGEIKPVDGKGVFWWRRWMMRLLRQYSSIKGIFNQGGKAN